MSNHLIHFIKNHQVPLIKIYIEEYKKIGPGALFVMEGEKSKVNVAYYPIDKIEVETLKKNLEAKIEEISNLDTFKVENKVIYSLPTIPSDTLTTLPVVYFVIVKNSKEQVLLGIPQYAEVDNKQELQYLLITDPNETYTIESHWTVSGTYTGHDFIQICQKALEDEEIYQKIRSTDDFNQIIINGEQWEGEKHLQRLVKDFPDLLPYLDKFRENDLFGSPQTYDYQKYGQFSANTLRYVNTLMDLKEYFNIKENWNLVELGSGYGGLVKTIYSYLQLNSYTLIDLEPVLKLSQKYLADTKNLTYLPCDEIEKDDQEYQLLISEYSLTELEDDGMELYFKHLFPRCQNAYIVANIWDIKKKKEFIKKLEEIYYIVEEHPTFPKTEWPNYILLCYEKK